MASISHLVLLHTQSRSGIPRRETYRIHHQATETGYWWWLSVQMASRLPPLAKIPKFVFGIPQRVSFWRWRRPKALEGSWGGHHIFIEDPLLTSSEIRVEVSTKVIWSPSKESVSRTSGYAMKEFLFFAYPPISHQHVMMCMPIKLFSDWRMAELWSLKSIELACCQHWEIVLRREENLSRTSRAWKWMTLEIDSIFKASCLHTLVIETRESSYTQMFSNLWSSYRPKSHFCPTWTRQRTARVNTRQLPVLEVLARSNSPRNTAHGRSKIPPLLAFTKFLMCRKGKWRYLTNGCGPVRGRSHAENHSRY